MKLFFTFLLSFFFCEYASGQIGGGWDWAFNTGAMGPGMKHLKYQSNGELLFGGNVLANAYFGATNLSATAVGSYPGNILVLGKISTTGNPTVIRSFSNPLFSFDCITTDDAGNFYVGGGISSLADIDFGNGVIIPGSEFNKAYIARFNAGGEAVWAKTFSLGVVGGSGNPVNQVLRLAVSGSGNLFFVGFNASAGLNNSKYNYPVYKLDNNGNTLWFKNTFNSSINIGFGSNEYVFKDQFIDNAENVQLMVVSPNRIFNFDGIDYSAPLVTLGGASYVQHISLDGSGNVRFVNSYRGGFNNFSVDRTSGNIHFYWAQYETNNNTLSGVPIYGAAPYPGLFTGIVKCTRDGVLLKAKKLSDIGLGNYNAQVILPISGDRLLIYNELEKTLKYGYGVDYLYPADATYDASGIAETDNDWNIVKLISGGKANSARCQLLAANGDTYAMVAEFGTNSTTSLPTTTYGTTTLTGFNAAANLTTAYGVFSTLRNDIAFVQCKSANFPMIGTTNWLGANTNWNDATNWTNGIPTNTVKAVFTAAAPNYPTSFTSPTTGTLQINSGATVTLPTTLTIAGGIKNDGIIKINNAGFFQAFGATEWKGSGEVEFTGSNAVSFFSARAFTNAITINSAFSTFYDMALKGINFKAGKFDMGGKTITITDPASTSISGTSPTSYFTNGTLSRSINSTGSYEFPIGTTANFQSATVVANNLVGVGALSASYTNAAITGTLPAATLNGVLISSALNGGRFTISPNQQPADGNYSITLKIKGSTNTVSDASRYAIIKRDNNTSEWAATGNYILATTDGTTVTATMTGLTSFSDFAIGIGASVLPVKLTSFFAQANEKNTRLTWVTASEVNNKGFNVQHSADGINYTTLHFVNGKVNSNQINHYTFIHASPVNGNNYYRLQQVDILGNFNYSSVQAVNFGPLKSAISVYPNPVVATINFNKTFAPGTTIQIINSIGQVVEQDKFAGNQYQPKNTGSGLYKVVITTHNPTIQYSMQLMKL